MLDILAIIKTYGYMGLFTITFVESTLLFPLPGDSLMFSSGILASEGSFNIFYLLCLCFLSSLLAGIVGYYIGKYLHIFHRYAFFRKLLHVTHIDRAHRFFEKRGWLVILLAKFFPILRTFVPICIGLAGMTKHKYMFYNFIGSILAPSFYLLAGYFLGNTFPFIQAYIPYAIIVFLFLPLVPLFKKQLLRKGA